VLLAGTSDYEQHMDSYKTGLMIATVVYFIAGTYWTAKREQLRAS
jgi:hypothetical protein